MNPPLRIGTRDSALARWQAHWVVDALRQRGHEVVLVPITTSGDREQTGPIASFGGVGVFTKEIQRALLDEQIDLAVHSLKDLPTEPVPGLTLAAVPLRGPVGDVLVCRSGAMLEQLPAGARIGTGSLRRRAQLLHARPDLVMIDIRGNVDTRIRKLDEGSFDAIVLAEAGLVRLELAGRITQRLSMSLVLPAVGQGALGLEARLADNATRAIVAALDDPATHAAVVAERALLASLRGGCLAPVGAWGRVEPTRLLKLDAVVASADGTWRIAASGGSPISDAQQLGQRVADDLLRQGAAALIAESRNVQPDGPSAP